MDQKRIAFFDIDRTIYNGYLIFPLAQHFLTENIIKKTTVDLLYADLLLYQSKQKGYETTIEDFNRHFASGLKSCSPESLLGATTTLLKTREGSNFFAFTRPLMELLRETHDIYLVTGELQFVGRAVAIHFSLQGYLSSEMEVKEGVFTGNVGRSLARKEGKRDAIEQHLKAYPFRHSMAFGDSEGDIDMLGRVDHAFCINASAGLMEVAIKKGWNMVTPLTVLETVRGVIADL